MQEMEVLDYVNEPPRSGTKHRWDANQTGRRIGQLLLLSFGILCVIQAALNVSLRLALFSSRKSAHFNCNTIQFPDQGKEVQDCGRWTTDQHNRLQEKFNALTRDKNLLENHNTELRNMLKKVEEERDRLKMKLREQSGVSSQGSPAGWREINSRCYFLSTERKTWEDSRKYCQANGADLVVINSEQEQRALYRLDEDAYLLFWIGLNDIDGTFKWVDGSALTNSFWKSGQPDHGGPNNREDCVEMYHFNPVLANWNDAPCGQERRWLCERSCNSS